MGETLLGNLTNEDIDRMLIEMLLKMTPKQLEKATLAVEEVNEKTEKPKETVA